MSGPPNPVDAPDPQGACPLQRVLVTTCVPDQRTAWTKARRDVMHLARAMGYGVFPMPEGLGLLDWGLFLSALGRRLPAGAVVLVEYPFDQRRRLFPLVAFCRLRRIRLLGLIHDLDALRMDSPPAREATILKLFDGLVSHNPSMTAWLHERGITCAIAELGMFDYLTQGEEAWCAQDMQGPVRIACAANLSASKAGYVYDPRLSEVQGVEFSLFGAFFEPERLPPGSPVRFHGVFDPDTPALDGRYHFGLVWDGEDITRCDGRYGRYLRFNNPHKLSLYAALGLPVVVWKEAAVARLVREQAVGVAVGDLRELGSLSQTVSTRDYRRMAVNMAVMRRAVTGGAFLRRALDELISGQSQPHLSPGSALQ